VRKKAAKRIVTIALLLLTSIFLAILQPVFFGVKTYFGIDPRLILLPLSFVCIVMICCHLYQNWPLMLAWFKKSPDRKKRRDKLWRMVVLIVFMLVLAYDLAFAWYEALTSEKKEILEILDYMKIWSWVATGLLAVHVWQRWKLTFSYFKR
jgi:membrane protein YdbS with pleckstrin-like domain